nr:dolichyl-phosphate beta-glucosyltransferase-like [Tanacetum cinerariifolium]
MKLNKDNKIVAAMNVLVPKLWFSTEFVKVLLVFRITWQTGYHWSCEGTGYHALIKSFTTLWDMNSVTTKMQYSQIKAMSHSSIPLGFHVVVLLAAGLRVRDTQCGFKMFTRAAARKLFTNIRLKRKSTVACKRKWAHLAMMQHQEEGETNTSYLPAFCVGWETIMQQSKCCRFNKMPAYCNLKSQVVNEEFEDTRPKRKLMMAGTQLEKDFKKIPIEHTYLPMIKKEDIYHNSHIHMKPMVEEIYQEFVDSEMDSNPSSELAPKNTSLDQAQDMSHSTSSSS